MGTELQEIIHKEEGRTVSKVRNEQGRKKRKERKKNKNHMTLTKRQKFKGTKYLKIGKADKRSNKKRHEKCLY